MAAYPHLPQAPIQEALIDLRAKLPRQFDPKEFASLRQVLQSELPVMKERKEWIGRFDLQADKGSVSQQSESRVDGFRFESEDGKNIAQLRSNGFSYHRLRPYGTWDEISDGAKRIWPLYVNVANPEAVIRMAVRYINRFELPVPTELDDYLVKPGDVPEGVEGDITNFLWKVGFSEQNTSFKGTVTRASELRPDQRAVDLILDIDCFLQQTFEPADDQIWVILEGLRDLKNRIFFQALTPRALEMFK